MTWNKLLELTRQAPTRRGPPALNHVRGSIDCGDRWNYRSKHMPRTRRTGQNVRYYTGLGRSNRSRWTKRWPAMDTWANAQQHRVPCPDDTDPPLRLPGAPATTAHTSRCGCGGLPPAANGVETGLPGHDDQDALSTPPKRITGRTSLFTKKSLGLP